MRLSGSEKRVLRINIWKNNNHTRRERHAPHVLDREKNVIVWPHRKRISPLEFVFFLHDCIYWSKIYSWILHHGRVWSDESNKSAIKTIKDGQVTTRFYRDFSFLFAFFFGVLEIYGLTRWRYALLPFSESSDAKSASSLNMSRPPAVPVDG